MSSITHPRKQRKPLEPVNVRAYFVGGASRQDVLDGAAVLSLTDLTTNEEAAYWCRALYDGGRCTGFRLTKLGSPADVYDVPRALTGCDCPDAAYRPERPGGCRHQQALRQALPTVRREGQR
jgi:hypothetical protein